MFKINRKGYMLVEIILASAIAFGLAYFLVDLTIKLKNKNDDLLVESQVYTDQAIVSNKIMEYAMAEGENFDCGELKVIADKNKITYKDETIDIFNKYVTIGQKECANSGGKISIRIPVTVKQMGDKDFDIVIDYKYKIGDMTNPTCTMTVTGSVVNVTYHDNDGGSGVLYYGWDENYTGENSDSKVIDSTGTLTFYVKDMAGNTGSCSMSVMAVVENNNQTCTQQCNGFANDNGCFALCYAADSKQCNGRCDPHDTTTPTDYCCYYYNGDCYKKIADASSCTTETSYSCANSGYTVTSDNKYCYKIN